MRNRSPGGWGGGGRESCARPSFPISIRYKRDGVRIGVKLAPKYVQADLAQSHRRTLGEERGRRKGTLAVIFLAHCV